MKLAPFLFAMAAASLAGVSIGIAAGAPWGCAAFAVLVFVLCIADGVGA